MTEIVHVPEPTGGTLTTRADLRNATTDSWTEVVAEVAKLAGHIAGTDFVPKAMRDNPAAVAAAILHGREVGFAPMTALAQTHVIDGRVSISAEAMRALVLQHGHQIRIGDMSSSAVTIAGRRAGDDQWASVTWTVEDARRADLTGKTNWKKYPRQMLLARATTELLRAVFPDVIHGLMSTEELDELVAAPAGPQMAIEGTTAPKTTTVSRKRAASRQKTAGGDEGGSPTDPTPPPAQGEGESAPPLENPSPAPLPDHDGPELDPTDDDAGEVATREAAQREIRELAEEKRQLEQDAYATTTAPLTSGDGQPPAKPADVGAPVSGMQRGKIMAELKRIGVDTSDDGKPMRLTYLAALAGRETLASTNDLSFREAHAVINRLTVVTDLADLEAKLAALGGGS